VILRPKSPNHIYRFWGQNRETRATSFEAKSEKTITTGFEAKPEKTVTTDFEVKPEKVVPVILRPNHWQTIIVVLRANHWQTVDLGFEAQSWNSCFSSPRAQCRLHTASPDLPIAQPPSTWLVRQSSSLLTMPHLSPTHHETSKHDSSHKTKDKGKTTKMSKFEFKSQHVNDSSHIKLRY
jgi:hypothetical protein